MATPSVLNFKQLFTHIVGDMAQSICVRNGESPEQRLARLQAATQMIMSFMPRDVIEVMLAGHCVMFHEVMTDSVHETLSGEIDSMRRATRANIVAMNRCFGDNLTRLERYQRRPSEGRLDAPEAKPEAAPANVADRPDGGAGQTGARPDTRFSRPPAAPASSAPIPGAPTLPHAIPAKAKTAGPSRLPERSPITRDMIAACEVNPEAMEALDAGDPARFARALGVEPTEEFLAAATSPGSPFARGV